MKNIIRITTDQFGKQTGVRMIKNEETQELRSWSQQYNIEYFDENEVMLPDGDYPEDDFDPIYVAANFVEEGEAPTETTYRGYQVKEELKKFKNQ